MSGAVDPDLDPDLGADALTAPSPGILFTVIGVGGAVGTLARYELGQTWHTTGSYGFSWATFVANLSGAFLLGLLIAVCGRWWPHAHYLRPALGTGLLGGYTTFSTYTVETVLRLDHGHSALGLGYLVLTLLGGLTAAVAGLALGGLGGRA
jgi:CrcB protein